MAPKIGAHFTRYFIDPNTSGFQDSTRTLPILSVDSGLVFERQGTLGGNAIIQTLEPRAYYVYIPFRDQTGIPNFDSGQQDINFATIYSENQFAGSDRINDANQITVGVTSRFMNAATGSEMFRRAWRSVLLRFAACDSAGVPCARARAPTCLRRSRAGSGSTGLRTPARSTAPIFPRYRNSTSARATSRPRAR